VPKLLIHEGGQQSVFELFDDETTIGRGAANVVQVADAHASKHQAVVRRVAGRMKLIDLESKNGTRVNGEFKNQRWLEHGDVITIGAMTVSYDAEGATAAATPTYAAPARALVSGPAVSVDAQAPLAEASRARRARRSRDDEYDDDDRGPRVPARRGSNSAAVAILAGVGVLGLIAAMMFAFAGSSNKNADALAVSRSMEKKGRSLSDARAYLVAHSNPNDRDGYVSVLDQLRTWDDQLQNVGESAKTDEAKKVMSKIIFDVVEQHKNRISDEDFGRRLLKFIDDYKGTPTAMELQAAAHKPYPKLRAFIEKARTETPK